MPVLRWPGATARYFHFRVPVETGTPPRRRKLHIPRFRLKPKTRSFCCSSSPNRTRCAGLRFGTAALPPLGRNRSGLGKSKAGAVPAHLCAPVRETDAYSGKIRPSPARGSPRRRCPRLPSSSAGAGVVCRSSPAWRRRWRPPPPYPQRPCRRRHTGHPDGGPSPP